MNTPGEMLTYVIQSEKESDFLSRIMLHKQNYTIAEVGDASYTLENGECRLKSPSYRIDLPITDDEIVTAVNNKIYVSTFVSRHDHSFQLHFLVHPYPIEKKSDFEEEIAKSVVRYMILKTIIALRLNTWRKIDEYLAS